VDKQRFISLWKRCQSANGNGTDAEDAFAEVLARYSEPGRHYHTPKHIEHCLEQFDLVTKHLDDADSVEMAIWFHDLVFDVTSKDNEFNSAQRFVELASNSMDPEFKARVHALIMATAPPRVPKTNDEQYVLDIDLSSFGLPWEDFLRDSNAVRQECSQLSDGEFFPGQLAFLKSLIAREHFYFTEFFRSRIEITARENIELHLQNLREKGVV